MALASCTIISLVVSLAAICPAFGQQGAAATERRATLAAVRSTGCQVELCTPAESCDPGGTRHTACLKIEFQDLAWKVCIENRGRKGLWLESVQISHPGNVWTQLLKHSGPAEIYTPYHEGPAADQYHPNRIFDTRFCGVAPPGCMDELVPTDLPAAGGFLVTLQNDTVPRVAVECRPRGIAWLCKTPPSGFNYIRRGYEVVIWAVLDTGNYDFIYEYTFRDDGSIAFRMGATGFNAHGDPGPFNAHMHDVLWRVDVDLAGQSDDQVFETYHQEPLDSQHLLNSLDGELPYNGGFEGPLDWDALSLTTLLVEDSLVTNTHGNHVGYELMPWNRPGTVRHYGVNGSTALWTEHDFWVTVGHPGEDGRGGGPINNWAINWHHPDEYLLTYASTDDTHGSGTGPEALIAADDVVLWYNASAHHHPHDEDRAKGDTGDQLEGITNVHWFGFDLHPHNYFDYNPLGGPCRCGVAAPPCR